jgi:hypothetical protein
LSLPVEVEPFCIALVTGILDFCFGVRSLIVTCLSFAGDRPVVLLLAFFGGVG